MARLVQVSATDLTLWHLSLKYLGDPSQAGRIAAINNLSDFWLFNLSGPTELLIPDPDPTQADFVPQQPGTDYLGLFGLAQSGTQPGGGTGTGPTAETLTVTNVTTVAAGTPASVSGLFTGGPPTSLNYQIDNSGWMLATGCAFKNSGFTFTIQALTAGDHTIEVQDSNATTVVSVPFVFVVTTASGSTGGGGSTGGNTGPQPAPLGSFVLGVNNLAPGSSGDSSAFGDLPFGEAPFGE